MIILSVAMHSKSESCCVGACDWISKRRHYAYCSLRR